MYSLYHGSNYSYLMLTYFIGSSYMSNFFCKNGTYIALYMGSVMGVVCVVWFRVHLKATSTLVGYYDIIKITKYSIEHAAYSTCARESQTRRYYS